MAVTMSQQANALLSSYAAIEAQQMALADNPASNDGLGAVEDQLSENALRVADELRALRDRSGNADFIAARVLQRLMLQHWWAPEAGIAWDAEAKLDLLPILESVADRTTGEIRRETRRALATIGIEISAEADDVMLDLCERERLHRIAYIAAPFETREEEQAWEAANNDGAGKRLCTDPPPIATEAGMRAALRYIAEDVDFLQEPHARILARVLEYLDGRAAA